MALVPSTKFEPASQQNSSSCCRLFYEAKINGLTVRRMIFKNIKRLSPQTGLVENRPFLSAENGRYLTAKEIKPGDCIQTDKIEIENQSRRRRSSSNLGLVSYKNLQYYRILDKFYLSKLPPTISAAVNSNLIGTVTLFDNAVTKQIATETATKHNEKKQSMQVVVKKEPSYEEITTDSFLNGVKRSRSESANTSGSRTSPVVSDYKKFQKLQSDFIQERDLIIHRLCNCYALLIHKVLPFKLQFDSRSSIK